MSGILQFIHGARFIASPLSTLANDFSGGIHKIKCKHGCHDKNVKPEESNISIPTVVLNTQILKVV